MRYRPDLHYLETAYEIAKKSLDPNTQNGAVLVNNQGRIIGVGNNHFAHGISGDVENTQERWTNREQKYKLVVHAEVAAIIDAARTGERTMGSTLYGCWVCCTACANVIIDAGVERVVGHHHDAMDERPEWQKSIDEAIALLRECNVQFRTVRGEIGKKIRFNGKVIKI